MIPAAIGSEACSKRHWIDPPRSAAPFSTRPASMIRRSGTRSSDSPWRSVVMRRGYQVAGPRADRKRVESRVAGRFVARETRHSFRFVSRSSRFSVALGQAGFCSGDGAMWRLEQSRRFAFAPCRLSPSNPLVTMGAPGSVLKNLTRRESRSPAATGHRLRLHVASIRRRFGNDDRRGISRFRLEPVLQQGAR